MPANKRQSAKEPLSALEDRELIKLCSAGEADGTCEAGWEEVVPIDAYTKKLTGGAVNDEYDGPDKESP